LNCVYDRPRCRARHKIAIRTNCRATDVVAEARANYAEPVTVQWRYAILRMHEVLALVVPHVGDDSLQWFNRYLKPVFADEYLTG
jgi:hypothetical protein